MVLKEDDNAIEIRPRSKFVADLLVHEIKERGGSNLHPSIFEGAIILPNDYSNILDYIAPIHFLGGNDQFFSYRGDIHVLYDGLCEIINKHSKNISSLNNETIDDILFITLFSWLRANDPIVKDRNEKYLDELIGLYLKLKRKKISTSKLEGRRDFARLQEDDQIDMIYNEEVMVEGRMIGGASVNNFVYIPSEYNLAIKGSSKNEEDILLPRKLSSRVYSLILDEIIQQHKQFDTRFYRMLCNEEFDADKLMDRTSPKSLKTNLRLLNSLATLIEGYLNTLNNITVISADKYRLIYDVLWALGFIRNAKEDKAKYIRKLLDDHKPEKHAIKQGEKQLYKK